MDFTAIGAKRDREAEFYKLSCLGAIRFQIGRLSLSLSVVIFLAFSLLPSGVLRRPNNPGKCRLCRPSIVHAGLPVKVERRARAEGDRCSLLWTLSTTLERTFCLLFQCRTSGARQRHGVAGPSLDPRAHPPRWTWHDWDKGSTFSVSNSADQESGIDHRLAAHHPVSGEALIKVTIEKL